MQLIDLGNMWTIILDILIWGVIHIVISLITLAIREEHFRKNSGLYQIRSWEREGKFWGNNFKIKRWKHIVPDGAKLFKKGFQKKELLTLDVVYLETFIRESRRAELTHWLCIPPALLFFLWNPPWAGTIMIVYALVVNIPIIMLQRYNRARLQLVVKRKKGKGRLVM
ncbi:glycosyl-4,4'-diaponeurosporenoate acyltransferase [Gracilibacillus salinarum]|uniref:Glycosyl-4,4'-diaponeurosporenoate acyltransferase n=1 Tax=Gracilibacillus salinarum TaxID=2932255 RepID=A0ABY4GKP1_9BACI|nr:glycosyl-4,4'-diaponeurosporenoate acyltransferase [Gracilibacillus salinarum]UOQ84779.1 glycosyl-4,4'-diaponeurosporenoate acyltransferase [Gracilibacillus salinarum]